MSVLDVKAMQFDRGALGNGRPGTPTKRVEDSRFLNGRGRYLPNHDEPDAQWVAFVRSPYAHARVGAINLSDEAQADGVVLLTGADMEADRVGTMRPIWSVKFPDGRPMAEPARWALARGIVRHVGEPVAIVVAGSRKAAQSAADLAVVEYEELPVVTAADEAMRDGAPQLHPEAKNNICVQYDRGDRSAVEAAMHGAPHLVNIKLVNNRLAGAAIEPRSVIAKWDPFSEALTLWTSTQAPHAIRADVSRELGLSENSVRVIAPDVGGGFGYKGKHYCEEIVLAWAARRINRPVRWTGSRTESFLADLQSRDHITDATMAFDDNGRILALNCDTIVNIGAHVSSFGVAVPTVIYSGLLSGVYRVPAIFARVSCVYTNTIPTDAYRGAGRPEACYVLERMLEKAAAELGIEPVELKRRNLIPLEEMPYKTAVGVVYDCGNFPQIFNRAVEKAGYDSFEQRREQSRANGKLRGIGTGMFVESSGAAPSRLVGAAGGRLGFYESAELRLDRTGAVSAFLGTHNHGQGHETAFAQLLHELLGVPFNKIRITEGDTGAVPYGSGTYGSRSMAVGGSAIYLTANKIIAKGKLIVAHLLDTTEDMVSFAGGIFSVKATNKSMTIEEVANAANLAHNLPLGMEPGLHETSFFDPPNFAYSNGCHVAEVEVDPDTGVVELLRYVAVDDVGNVINPMIVHGQVHGGIAQGAGQALMEQVLYDADNGQLLTGSFMDYGIPKASMFPSFDTETDQSQPFPGNPLGAKGCGEAGSIGAPAAIVSAVLHALRPHGVTDISMPVTSEKVWQALKLAEGEAR